MARRDPRLGKPARPKTANEELFDGIARRAASEERWRAGLGRRAAAAFGGQLMRGVVRHAGLTAGAKRAVTQARRQAMAHADLLKAARESLAPVKRLIKSEIADAALAEADWQVARIRKALRGSGCKVVEPRPELVARLAKRTTFHGATMDQWVAAEARKLADRARQQIARGAERGQGAGEIKRAARDDPGGVEATAGRDLRSLARTAAAHAQAVARELVYAANGHLFRAVVFVAVLDSRTTPLCRSLDAKIYPVSEAPRPPLHFNCRSTTMPVIKSWRGLCEGAAGDKTRFGGDMPRMVSYGEWLAGQSDKVQDDALGKTRARLFREGKIEIDGMVDQERRPLTLDELRKRHGLVDEDAAV